LSPVLSSVGCSELFQRVDQEAVMCVLGHLDGSSARSHSWANFCVLAEVHALTRDAELREAKRWS
jgi:hypothetical protein